MNSTPRLINRNFTLAFCAQMALMSVYQILVPTLPLYLKRLGSTEIEVGTLVGIMGIASVVARPVVGKLNPGLFFTTIAITLIVSRTLGGRVLDMPNKKVLVLLCLATSILSMVVLSLSRTQPRFLLSAVIWSAGHAYLIPSLLTLALARAGSSPSPVVATFYAISDLGVFVGPLIMGVVVHYTSYPVMFFCLSLVAIVNFLYFWWFSGSR
jgi:hypothetical protein